MPTRSGVTLIELLVVLVLLGLIFTVSGLALSSLSTPRQSGWTRSLEAANAKAIRSGVPVLSQGASSDTGSYGSRPPAPVLFLPDGRALGPGVDPLTGAPVATR